ncbi:hypothetical protein ACGF13_02460 [Kitasatospora sp. NPDC048286]|uniref:hypothetical protein n=1 Tax=unclassified Kitasatospora TaxID=2633591 RepID=UPI003720AC55
MTAPVDVNRCWRECRARARRDGIVEAVRGLNTALSPHAPPRGPGGHALVPADAVPLPGGQDGPGLGAAAAEPAAAAGARASVEWQAGLVWVRLGTSEGLRDAVVARLAKRTTDGTPLLMKQLVQGALADVLMEQLEAECVLSESDVPPDAAAMGRLHDRITLADRALLRLLGAHGFTVPGPGWDAHLSELLADVHREPRSTTPPEES